MSRETASARLWRAYKLQGRQLRRRERLYTWRDNLTDGRNGMPSTRTDRRERQRVLRRAERKARHRQAVAQRMAADVLAGDAR